MSVLAPPKFRVGDVVQHKHWPAVTAKVVRLREASDGAWQHGYWVERVTGQRPGYDRAGFTGDLFGEGELEAIPLEDQGMLF